MCRACRTRPSYTCHNCKSHCFGYLCKNCSGVGTSLASNRGSLRNLISKGVIKVTSYSMVMVKVE